MKLLEANGRLLSNFEVMDLLKSRGADKGIIAAVKSVTPSECKVYEYLVQTPAGTQSRQSLENLNKDVALFSLTKAERVQIANLRPIADVEVHVIIEDCDQRLGEKLDNFLQCIEKNLPPPPVREGHGAQNEEDMVEAKNE